MENIEIDNRNSEPFLPPLTSAFIAPADLFSLTKVDDSAFHESKVKGIEIFSKFSVTTP